MAESPFAQRIRERGLVSSSAPKRDTAAPAQTESPFAQRIRERGLRTSLQQGVDPNTIESDYTRGRRLANENNLLRNYSAQVMTALGSAGTGMIGLVAPETADRLQQGVEDYYGPIASDTFGQKASSVAGSLIAGAGLAAPSVATGGVAGASMAAGQFGAMGAGGTRRDYARGRSEGRELDRADEITDALMMGFIEGGSGAFTAGLSRVFGRASAGMMTGAKEALRTGGRKGLSQFIRSSGVMAGGAVAEGLEETGTQIAGNLVASRVLDPDRPVTEGAVEAGLTGAALAPFLQGIGRAGFGRGRAGAQVKQTGKEVPNGETQTPAPREVLIPTSETEQLFGPVTGKGEIDTAPTASQDAGAAQTALADLGNESGEYTAGDIQKYVGGMEGKDGAALVTSMLDDGPYVVVEAPVDAINENVLQAGDVDAGKAQDAAELSAAGSTPPPVVVGRDMMIADGTHRLLQARKSGKATIGAVMSKAQANALGLTPVSVRGGISQQAKARQQAPVISTKPVKLPAPSGHKRMVPKWLEAYITPESSRVIDIAPRVGGRLAEYDYNIGTGRQKLKDAMSETMARMDDIEKSHPQGSKIALALRNQDYATAESIAKQISPEAVADVQKTSRFLKGMYKLAEDAGIEMGFLEDHFPRRLKSHKKFAKEFGFDDPSRYEEALKQAQDAKGAKQLTDAERTDVINQVQSGFGPVKPGSRGTPHARKRRIETLTPEMLKHYEGFGASLESYIDSMTAAIERAKFLGKGTNPANLKESIGSFIQREIDAGNIDKASQDELHDLITARLMGETKGMGPVVKGLRQATHLTALSNLVSTVRQITDIGITAMHHGELNVGLTAAGQALNIKRFKRVIVEDLGLSPYGSEFADRGKLAKATDGVLTTTGFKRLDRFGKEVRMNAALRKFERASKKGMGTDYYRMKRDYAPVMGSAAFGRTVADLSAGRISENVKLMLFLDITRVQPVTLSQMPQAYLNEKNGRIWYTLRSFMLMQLDVVRRDMFRKLRTKGQRAEGLANLARYALLFGLLDAGVDLFKDWIRGRRIGIDQIPDRAVDALLGLVGLNKYILDTAVRKGQPVEAFWDWILPATTLVSDPFQDARNLVAGKMGETGVRTVRHIPVIGDLVHAHAPWGAGFKANAKERKTFLNKRSDALRDEIVKMVEKGEEDRATAAIVIYNGTKPANRPALDLDSAEQFGISRRDRARSKAVTKAAEQMMKGDRAAAQSLIDEHNASAGDDSDPIDFTEAEDRAAEFREQGRTE